MRKLVGILILVPLSVALLIPLAGIGASAQVQEKKEPGQKEEKKEPPFGKGPGGFKGMFGQTRKLLKQFDKDGDGRLNNEERQAAREFIKKERAGGGFGPGKGGFGMKGGNREPAKPGPAVAPADVKSFPNAALYEPTVLRTIFLEFENKDWEAEVADFYHSDVEVPATVTVDGKKYPNVGVHFRGASSFFGVPAVTSGH